MKPARSLLFIPGNREEWVRTASTNDADVVILDLEDSVPPENKGNAREIVAEYVPTLRERGQRVHVRVNGHPNTSVGTLERDLEAIVPTQPEALMVPDLESPEDVRRLDTVLMHIERREGLTEGGLELSATIETAPGMRHVYELCDASDRVASIVCGAVKGTDTNRALGFDWTGPGRDGLETLHMREKALLDARAAGIEYPLAGPYVDIEDIKGVREDMAFSREMGYTGYVIIHPTHVEHANECFTPDPELIEYWVNIRRVLAEAEAEGKSAIRYEGEMIDTANLGTADQYLEYAREFADDLNADIDVRVDDE